MDKKSLKKLEIEMGNHQELDIPWDQPVPEERWVGAIDTVNALACICGIRDLEKALKEETKQSHMPYAKSIYNN